MISRVKSSTAVPNEDFNPFAGSPLSRVVPTTEAQREIWLADQLSPEASLAYNESISLRLAGRADRQALLAAIQDVIDAHEALRATISADGQELLVAESVALSIAVSELGDRSEAQKIEAIEAAKLRAVNTQFDLTTGPLVRAELLVSAPEEHLLVFTAHHIVCDGWSFGVIVRDLAAFYSARVGVGNRPTIGGSFADYAERELQHAGSEQRRVDESFWLSKFAGPIPTMDLPTDRLRKAWRTFASRRADIFLDPELTAGVRRWGAKLGAGLPATLTGAFAVMLHRISGASSIVVGMPAAGQSIEGQDRLVGHCVNLLPLRIELDDAAAISSVITDTRTMILDAYDHQRYTFGTLLQKLTVPRDPGRLPLVSVLFNVDQALDESSLEFANLSFEFAANPRCSENFELFVNAVPTGNQLRLEIQYNSDMFDDVTITRWFDAYKAILHAALADGSQAVGHLAILSQQASQEVVRLQPARTPYESEVLLHEFIERQIDAASQRPAVTFGAETISYAELDARANRIAHALRRLGIRRGVAVGLCVNRSIDMVTSIVGILKAGGTHVPLDPAFPPERLSFMAEDSALGALITASEHFEKIGVARSKSLLLDEAGALGEMPASRLLKDSDGATPDTAAYIIYTSGSTGKPKGVLVTHRAIANLLASLRHTPGIEASDTLVAVTTLSFDIAVFELILPLTVGARVVVAARDQARDAGSLRNLLETSGATVMQATPAGWRLLLESGWNGHRNFKAVSGGEPLAPDLAAALLQRCASVWNGYGPTETTVYSTFWRVENPERGISIGRPVANTTVWILDENQQPCVLGVPGEICIGGDGVTPGYLNRPELNAERFLANTFDANNGRIYRTGDRGRWLRNGTLEHLGRLDFQIKIRGYRVELGEIEANLLSLPDVARAVAMSREDRPRDVRLVAYVVPQPGVTLSEALLRQHLQKILPEYFVPQHFVVLTAIPLLPNGKVDRRALPAPEAATSDREFVAPRTELETAIAKTMEAVLGLPGIGIHDDFFALGGHSLLAAQLTARLNRDLNVSLTLRTLFDAPTIAGLVEQIQSQQAAGPDILAAPIASRAEQRKAPLSIMQERLWFLDQLHPGRVVYNTPSAHRLRGSFDYEAFDRAFSEMIQHQPSLRTSIATEAGMPQQIVHEQLAFSLLPAEDLSSVPANEQEAALRARLELLTNEPFDLTRAPLFRARLFRLSAQEHVLLFVPHHIIWDGWSFDLFSAELSAVYAAFLAERPSPLAPLSVTYGDFAVWHRKWLESSEFSGQINFWRERLADTSGVSELPTDRPRQPGMSGEGRTEWLSIDKERTTALRELSRATDATLFMTLLAIYYVLLYRISGQRHLVIGTPVRGRNFAEVEQVMGYFTNLLPLHLKVDPGETFLDLVKRVKSMVLDCFSCPDVPLEMLMRELTVQRGEGGSLLYQALFSFQDARHRASNWGGLSHEQILLFQRGATEDLGLWFLDNDHGMVGGVTYNADIITADYARLLRERYLQLTEAVLKTPNLPVAELPIELESDRKSLHSWNATSKSLGEPALLHDEFERTVDRTPTHPAAIVGGWSISYQEIEQQANRIAHCLQARGIKPGSVVALCDDVGQGFLSALLAIFKSGGTCLILDAALPTARVTAALKAAGAAALVTNSRLGDIANGTTVKSLWLDVHATEIAAAAIDRPKVDRDSDTSCRPGVLIDLVGMHGTPRLVTLSHDALLNTLRAIRDATGLSAGARCLVSGAPSAETSIMEWLLPLTAGATCVIAKAEATRDISLLRREIESGSANYVHLPVELWCALCNAGWPGSADLTGLITADRMPSECTEVFGKIRGRFWRAHGWAEAGIWSTLDRVTAGEDLTAVGKPLPNMRVHVLDEQRRLCPVGVFGEVWVSGAGLATGYAAEPIATTERFENLAIAGDAAQRCFRTTERGRWRSDGLLELIPSDQGTVRLGGTRIDLASLTAYVRAQEAISDALCVIREGHDRRPRVVAYVSSQSNLDVRSILKQALSERVPPVAGPAEVVVLTELTKLPDGRVDPRVLPAPEDHVGQVSVNSFVEPQTAIERMLAAIWCDLLGLPRVSSRDNFFDLGGHSLLAMQAISQMEQKTGKQIAARRYMFQTLAQLASSYEEAPATTPQKAGLVSKLLGALRGSNRG